MGDPLNEFRMLEREHRYQEAAAEIARLATDDPTNQRILAAYLTFLQTHREWKRAGEAAASMRAKFPKDPLGYRIGFQALIQNKSLAAAKEVLRQSCDLFPDQPWSLSNAALMADLEGHFEEGTALWERMRKNFPTNPWAWRSHAASCLSTSRPRLADKILADGLAKFPDDSDMAMAFGNVAEVLNNWDVVDDRWADASRRFPHHIFIRLRYALAPIASRIPRLCKWDEALSRLEEVGRDFPGHPEVVLAHIRVLRDSDRLVQARSAAEAATNSISESRSRELAVVAFAEICASLGDIGQGISALSKAYRGNPENPEVSVALSQMLARMGHPDEADEILAGLITGMLPNEPVLATYAANAMNREDWIIAERRWHDVTNAFPNSPNAQAGLAMSRLFLGQSDQSPEVEGRLLEMADHPVAFVLMQFASLGSPPGSYGCEFGFFQRKFGAEPVDLLRWTDISTEKLIEALEARFEGVGSPGQTELIIPNKRADYRTRDIRFGMDTHTFIKPIEMAREVALDHACRRISYLRRKLLADFEHARRIFVYADAEGELPLNDVLKMHDAMMRYGPVKLLHVARTVDPARRAVALIRPNLAHVSLPRAFSSSGEPILQDATAWLRICWATLRLLRPDIILGNNLIGDTENDVGKFEALR